MRVLSGISNAILGFEKRLTTLLAALLVLLILLNIATRSVGKALFSGGGGVAGVEAHAAIPQTSPTIIVRANMPSYARPPGLGQRGARRLVAPRITTATAMVRMAVARVRVA